MDRKNNTPPHKPIPMPDSVIGLSERSPDALANLACFAIDSAAGGTDCYVGIDFMRFRAAITWIEALSPTDRLSLAIDIVGYLKALTQILQATPPRKIA